MTYNPTPIAAKRPLMLTILCIVSIVFNIWSFAGGADSAFSDRSKVQLKDAREKMEASMSQLNEAGVKGVARMLESAVEMAERSVLYAKPLGYSSMALAVIGIIGVVLMWRLRRIGFWFYVFSSIAGLVVPLVLVGGGAAAMVGIGVAGLVSVAFIVMYAINLKYMR